MVYVMDPAIEEKIVQKPSINTPLPIDKYHLY